MAPFPSDFDSAWELSLYRESLPVPDHRVPRRRVLKQIVCSRSLYPKDAERALDVIGEGRSTTIDPNAIRKLKNDISADRDAYGALLTVTPWRAPDGLYEPWEFVEDKIPTTLPIHLVLTLLLDLRERTLAALKWIIKIREALPDDYEPKDNPPAFIKRLKELEQYIDNTIVLAFGEAIAAELKRGFSPSLENFETARIAQREASMILRAWLRSKSWTTLGVQRQFHDAEKASLTAAVGAIVIIIRAATGRPYASQIGQLVRVTSATEAFLAKDTALDAERSFLTARASAQSREQEARSTFP